VTEIEIDDARPWRRKLLATIEQCYRRAPHFDETMPLVTEVILRETSLLADYNEAGVRLLAATVGLDASKFVRASDLTVTGSATDLLIEITRSLGGDTYLAGAGAGGYQEDEKFAAASVRLCYQAFEHPSYPQLTRSPHNGLSIIDALMHCGAAGTARMLGCSQREREPWISAERSS
jgi:hypothetical protein